ncbi:hypothetical protein HYW44_03355 [Candidatus Daviesbacteria bacterium]|nr:hypothetical protein [Candidatus Daviesbacteria bacterium]
MSKLIKIVPVLVTLLLVLIIPAGVLAQGDNGPGIKVSNLSVSQNKVSGKLDIRGENDTGRADAHYHIELYSEGAIETVVVEGKQYTGTGAKKLISWTDSDKFNIKSGEVRTFSLELEYPATVKSGKYTLLSELRTSDNQMLFFANNQINLTGSGQFITLSDSVCYFKIKGITYPITVGPNVEANVAPTAYCEITNPLNTPLTLKPRVVYSQKNENVFSKNGKVVFAGEQVTLEGNETKAIMIQLPALENPQVYDGLLSLVKGENIQISPVVHFRWIVEGKSAIINSLNLDKGYYKEGETASVIFSGGPSLDLSWRGEPDPDEPGFGPNVGSPLGNPEIEVQIKNSLNQICGSSKQKLPYDQNTTEWSDVKIDVAITRECKDPTLTASIVDGGQKLYKATKNIISSDKELGKEGVTPGKRNLVIILSVIVFVVAGIGGYVFYRRKRGPGSPPPIAPLETSMNAVLFIFVLTAISMAIAADTPLFYGSVYAAKEKDTMRLNITIDPYGPNTIKKQPVNSSDTEIKTVYHWRNEHSGVKYWMNFQDFKEASGSEGKSSVKISPDCKTIDILIDATSGNELSCGNWGSGVTVLSFLDNRQIDVTELSSPNGMKIFNSPYGPHSYTIYDYNDPSRKISKFKLINPNPTGDHKLELFLGSTSVDKGGSGGLKRFDTSFNILQSADQRETQCDSRTENCFGVLTYNFSCQPPPSPPISPPPSPPSTPPPACNTQCSDDRQCLEAKDGCTLCVGGVCKPPPACNVTCSNSSDCLRATDGCTSCVPNDAGTGNICRPTPACNTSCTSDRQCAGAKDGCIACVNGSCKVPPSCGTSCTTKAECSGVKDGCSQCLEGTCTDFNDNMCKCDGMIADMVYPSDSFNFEALGKVEGADVKKAQIADVTFRLTKDNQVIAKSNPITPSVVESSANKLRVKASWSTPPPQVTKGATYRVFADVRCKPKRIVASSENFNPNTKSALSASVSKPPPGLKLIASGINKLAGEGNTRVKSITGKLLSMFDASPAKAQTSNLQLQTLNFVKVLDTDNCRFVMFKYDETLF